MLFSIPLLLRKKIYNFSGNHYAKKPQYFSESPSVITPPTSVLTLLKKNNSSLRENKHTAKALGALSKVPCTARGFYWQGAGWWGSPVCVLHLVPGEPSPPSEHLASHNAAVHQGPTCVLEPRRAQASAARAPCQFL